MHHYWKLLLNPPVFWTFQLVWIVSSSLVNCNQKYAMYKRNISTTLVLLLLIYSSTLQELVLQISRFHALSAEKKTFSYRDVELWPMTLTYELNLDMIKMNHRASYRANTHRHTQQTNCSTWTTKWSVNISLSTKLTQNTYAPYRTFLDQVEQFQAAYIACTCRRVRRTPFVMESLAASAPALTSCLHRQTSPLSACTVSEKN